jgi:Transglycosylase SLT domain
MTCHTTRRRVQMMLCALIALGMIHPAIADPNVSCEQAGRAAEQAYGLPPGLLLAIGRVESGRWDTQLRRVIPWPWSIDANGQGRLYSTDRDAIAAVRTLQASGSASIDIGCFQVNLWYHPDAFASLEQALDPQANAQYAARFLSSLRARYGNWQDAVAAYHSATPDLGLPYRQRVFAAWTGGTDDSLISSTEFTIIAGVRVWGPSPASTAPQTIAVPAAVSTMLPRVISPSR